MKKYLLISTLIVLIIPLTVSATHTVTIDFPESGEWYNETIQIDYNTEDNPIECYMNFDGSINSIPCLTTISLDTTQCNDGQNTCSLEMIVTGDHGNVSDNVTFSVDNSPPIITNVSLNTSVASQNSSIEMTSDGNDPHGIKSCVARFAYENGTTFQPGGNMGNLGNDCNGSKPLPETIPEGPYLIRVVRKNHADATNSISTGITIDNTPPTANITSPEQNAILVNTTTIRGTATDDNFFNYKLEYCNNGCSEIAFVDMPVSDGLLGTWNTRITSNGNYTLKLTVLDLAGNSQTASVNVSLNNTIEPTSSHNFSGSVLVGGVRLNNGSTLMAMINGVEFASTEIINGEYGIESVFSIPGDNLSTDDKEGGVNGEDIEFFVDGSPVNENAVFRGGDFTELNFTIATLDELSITRDSENRTIIIPGSNTVDADIEIRTNQDVSDTPIELSKFTKDFLGGFSGSQKFLKSISIQMDESIIAYLILKVFYDDDELSSNDLNEDNLKLFRFNESISEWEEVSSTTDKGNNYVSANLSTASMFALTGIQTCSDGIENQDEEGIDCGGTCPNACETPDDLDEECTENWDCTAWSECSENIQTRECDDLNNCGTTLNKPSESISCDEIICLEGERECSGNDIRECREGTEWIVIETCEFGCAEGVCLEGNITEIPITPNISENVSIDSDRITGFFTAENAVFVSGLVIGIIVIVIAVVASKKRQKPVYKTFRYEYKSGT